jgi:hypothetical protein
MPAGFLTARVHYDHDTRTWLVSGNRPEARSRALTAATREAAQTEAETLLTRTGLRLVSAWTSAGDDEAGSAAVFAQAGSGDATKSVLSMFSTAHREVLAKLGVNTATLPAAQRALLLSQDAMLAGLARILVDKGVLTTDDLTAASGSAGAAELTGMAP